MVPIHIRILEVQPTPVPTHSVAQFYARTQDARKIMVVDLGFLGDSVQMVPVCWDLRRNYPEAELHTLSATVGAEVLALAPCVDRAWAYPLSNPSPPWWKHLDILRNIRREHFDLALSFSGSDRPVLVTALSGARHRLVHDSGRRHFYNPWLIENWVPRRPREGPVFEQRRQVLVAAGMTLGPARFDLSLPNDALDWAASTLPAGVIHLSPNASLPLKEWPLENWLELVPRLAAVTGRTLVATGDGSPRERARLESLAAAFRSPRFQVLPDRLPLSRLAAVLNRSVLHVGADSGVTHLAFALGIPTVTAYREYEGRQEWVPPGAEHRQLIVDCACVRSPRKTCVEARRAECLGQIRPEALLALCEAQLAR